MGEMAYPLLPEVLEERIDPVPPEVRLYTGWSKGRRFRKVARVAGQALNRSSMDGALVELRKVINAQTKTSDEADLSPAEAI